MKYVYLLIVLLSPSFLMAQKAEVSGKVTDEKDNSAMYGVNIKIKGTTDGTTTDEDGSYTLKVPSGKPFTLEFSYVGYMLRSVDFVALPDGGEKTSNVKMTDNAREMDIVVVTGSKYEKKFSEETVSLDVMKGQNITQSNQNLNEAVNKVPGVNMLGKTISIRGGSGFSDITGNRVLVLLDDVPMVSPENGGIRWETMPVEAINQMEVIKGAASASYGSSALNGLINVRTISPKAGESFSKIYTSIGVFDHHNNRDFWWFNRKVVKGKERYQAPVFGGISFVHASKIGNTDLTTNFAYQGNQGHTDHNSFDRVRGFMKLRYIPTKIPNLTFGMMMNVAYIRSDDFFLYKGYKDYGDYGLLRDYLASGDETKLNQFLSGIPTSKRDSFVLVPQKYDVEKQIAVNVNPYINFYDKHDNRHSLKMSYYYVTNKSTTGDTSTSMKYYGDYSFVKRFSEKDLTIATGISGYYSKINSVTFSERFEANAGAYLQVDKKFFKRWTISAGMRLEYYKLDNTSPMNEQWVLNKILNRSGANAIKSPVQPLFRFGTNFQATEGTFIRASFGQGYRFPSIAEKFVQTPRSGAYAVPNFNLRPESGWSAEIGIKQGVKISNWVFYADVAGFVNRYRDLIEFVNIPPDSAPVTVPSGFFIVAQAQNVTKAMIMGMEISTIGTGKIFGVPLNFLVGYTYMEPWNLNADAILKDPTAMYLNFRLRHSAKADVQTEYKRFILGITGTFTSQMLRIDPQFNIIAPIRRWREEHRSGDFVFDVRAGYNFRDKLTATAIVKNVTNREYVQRPGFVEAPRNYTLLVTYAF